MFVSLSLFLTTALVDTPRAVLFVGSEPPTEYIEKKVREADQTKLQDLMPDRLSFVRAGDVAIVWDKTDSLLTALKGATAAYKDFASSIEKSDGSVLKVDSLDRATRQVILKFVAMVAGMSTGRDDFTLAMPTGLRQERQGDGKCDVRTSRGRSGWSI